MVGTWTVMRSSKSDALFNPIPAALPIEAGIYYSFRLPITITVRYAPNRHYQHGFRRYVTLLHLL